jgi:hypothetical protein
MSTTPEVDLVPARSPRPSHRFRSRAISNRTVEAAAAVVSRFADRSDYGSLVEEGFGEAMVVEPAVRHLSQTP